MLRFFDFYPLQLIRRRTVLGLALLLLLLQLFLRKNTTSEEELEAAAYE